MNIDEALETLRKFVDQRRCGSECNFCSDVRVAERLLREELEELNRIAEQATRRGMEAEADKEDIAFRIGVDYVDMRTQISALESRLKETEARLQRLILAVKNTGNENLLAALSTSPNQGAE